MRIVDSQRKYEIFCVILVCSLATMISCYQITIPWIDGELASDGVIMGNAARNMLRYGGFQTMFGAVVDSGPVMNGHFHYYIDHPLSLFVTILALSFRIFGVHEWSARIVTITFSMGSLVMVYLVARQLWDKKIAFFSLLFMAFMPMVAYFTSRDVWPYSISLFGALLVTWFYISWIRQYENKYYYMTIVSYAVCLLLSWDVYFLGPILFLHHMLFKGKRFKLAFIFPMLNLIMFSIIVVHTYFLSGGVEQLWKVFLHRSAVTKVVTWTHFFAIESHRCWQYFTGVLCVLSAIGLGSAVFKKRHDNSDGWFGLFLFIWGVPFILLFREGAVHQIAWIFSLAPLIAVSGALGLDFLHKLAMKCITVEDSGKIFSVVLTVLVVFVFLRQSLPTVYQLHQKKSLPIPYAFANTANKVSKFEDAIITPINVGYYYYPYYTDRYVAHDVRTKDEYLNLIKRGDRVFNYYITTGVELMKDKFLIKGDMNKEIRTWLGAHGITEEPCELDKYISDRYVGKVVDSWIVYELSPQKTAL